MRRIIESLRVFIVVVFIALLIRHFIFQPYVVEGVSMEPNLHHGEYLIISKFPYHLTKPKRGDIVVIKYPINPSFNYIKRIIALENETIQIVNGKVLINGEELIEPYLSGDQLTTIEGSTQTSYYLTLGNDQYFVMGDNRAQSSDSRNWGPISKSLIIGRLDLVVYPSSSFRAIASPNYQLAPD